uniref:Uncharacterized protein n=1 Tax=Anguilla anguilla TaxID=7936 RepID=A0A0E9UL56_ANGAN
MSILLNQFLFYCFSFPTIWNSCIDRRVWALKPRGLIASKKYTS